MKTTIRSTIGRKRLTKEQLLAASDTSCPEESAAAQARRRTTEPSPKLASVIKFGFKAMKAEADICRGARRRVANRPRGHAPRRGVNHRSSGSRRTTARSSARSGDSGNSSGESEPGEHSRLTAEVAHA